MFDGASGGVMVTLALAVAFFGAPAWRGRYRMWQGLLALWRSVPQWPVIRHYRVRMIRRKEAKAAKRRAQFRVFPPPDDEYGYDEQEIKEGDENRESA